MGKASTRENKNIYFRLREEMGWTRAKASEELDTITEDRIEKIEYEKSEPRPDEVVRMAEVYKAPQLRNYYCANQCPIGMKYVHKLELKDLAHLTLELLSHLNTINKKKDELIDISADGKITEDEEAQFKEILNNLGELSVAIESLNLWVDKTENK